MKIAFKEAVNNYKANLTLIINEIRMLNPNSQLAFVGLYDPFAKNKPEKTKFLLEWNYETRLIIDDDKNS